MSIIAVGSLAFDSVKTPEGARERILGGSLSHFTNAASLLSKPYLVGVVGNDFNENHWEFIRSKSASTAGVDILENEKSFFWQGFYTEDFDTANTVTTELNAFAKFAPVVPDSYKKRDPVLFLANIDPVLQKNVALQCVNSRLKILDTMNYYIKDYRSQLEEAFSLVDGIVINEGEAFMLTGEKNLLKAADKLFLRNYQLLVIKRGSNGVMIFGKDFLVNLPAYPLRRVVDPTGAGDSFAGAFVSYIDAKNIKKIDQTNMKKAAAYATVVASFAVEDFGLDGIHKTTKADLEKRLREYQKMVSF